MIEAAVASNAAFEIRVKILNFRPKMKRDTAQAKDLIVPGAQEREGRINL